MWNIQNRLLATIADALRTARPPAILPSESAPAAPAETPEYAEARTEAAAICRGLGLDVTNERWDTAAVADFIRLAYAQGWAACEARLAAPDMADLIFQAIHNPETILARSNVCEPVTRWTVRAVQQVVAYGAPR
jgi:hypothetical protein